MSKIGKLPITIKDGIKFEEQSDAWFITGPKGKVTLPVIPNVKIDNKDGVLVVSMLNNEIDIDRKFWGLARALINNAVEGVEKGFLRELELVGVGYRVEKNGTGLKIAIGYSHPVMIEAPEGIAFEIEGNTIIRVLGVDRQLVGQVAANIRAVRKPEPYNGKGIKYKDEVIKRKQGKAAK
jgi:large subunit ribosomal protein L6